MTGRAGANPSLVVLLAGFMSLQPLATDTYLASLPALADYFEATAAAIQLTLSLFVIGFGVAQLFTGPLSDRHGRRPVILGGFALYCVAAALCAIAPSLEILIAARLAQAIGCCTVIVVARAIVRDVYTSSDGARVFARAGAMMSVVPIIGPIVGSYLQTSVGWRGIFFFQAGVALILFISTWCHLTETNKHVTLDATRLHGLIRNYRLVLRSPIFWAYLLPGLGSYCAIFVFISGASLALIKVLHVPTAYFGYCFAQSIFGYLCGTVLCRRLLATVGMTWTPIVGGILSASGGVLLLGAVWLGWAHWLPVLLAQFIVMLGHGINQPCSQSGAIAPFKENAGSAAGMLGFLTMAGALAIGTWLAGAQDGTLRPLAYGVAATTAFILMTSAVGYRWRRASLRA